MIKSNVLRGARVILGFTVDHKWFRSGNLDPKRGRKKNVPGLGERRVGLVLAEQLLSATRCRVGCIESMRG